MAKKAKSKRSSRAPKSAPQNRKSQAGVDVGPLDEALYVTYAGEAALGLVEYGHASVTAGIQAFPVDVQVVSGRPSDPSVNSDRARDLTRRMFQAHDHPKMPYWRVIGRVLDELLNHRRFTSCSGGDVFYVLLDELPDELPEAHRQLRKKTKPHFDKALNPGRRGVDNRLRELKGESRDGGSGSGLAFVETTSTTQGGAEQGYRLTEDGRWLFDGWPELAELARGRLRAT